MRRAEIPDGLLKARRADIDRIPGRVLAKMTRGDLPDRLVAAGEYRRRASVPHLDGDLYRYRLGLATEVLTTDDSQRAAELVKGAGVGVTIGTGRAAPPASAAGSAAGGRVTKAAPAEIIRYPAVDLLTQKAAAARSVAVALTELAKTGRLGELGRDLTSMHRDISSGRMELVKGPVVAGPPENSLAKSAGAAGLSKAAEYERKAAVVTDPELRRGYLELARQERAS